MKINRRRLFAGLAGAGAAAMAAGLPDLSNATIGDWVSADCAGCGLPVAFLPGQHVNTCGHCKTIAVR